MIRLRFINCIIQNTSRTSRGYFNGSSGTTPKNAVLFFLALSEPVVKKTLSVLKALCNNGLCRFIFNAHTIVTITFFEAIPSYIKKLTFNSKTTLDCAVETLCLQNSKCKTAFLAVLPLDPLRAKELWLRSNTRRLGVVMERTLMELRGIACIPLESSAARKNIISSRSLVKIVE